MNFLVPHSWLKELVPALPKSETTAKALSLSGPSIDRIKKEGTDMIYDAEITTNRADLWSLIGMAREAAAILGVSWKEPFLAVSLKKRFAALKRVSGKTLLSVRIEDPDLCPRYAGMMLDHIVVRESPAWMKARLLACGQRPINAVVDITNYVMLEYGQPMHAFDASKVVTNSKQGDIEEDAREIVVRRAVEKEKFVTLDGDEKILDSTMLVIADHAGPLALAGIKGGDRARVDENTHTIILESANFNPVSVRKTSRAVDIRTDSSSRFEKGLSAELPLFALARAAQLLIEICDARVVCGPVDAYPKKEKPCTLRFDPRDVHRILGIDIPLSESKRTLIRLGFGVKRGTGDTLSITVPFWRRADMAEEGGAGVVEEIARIHGYATLPRESIRGAVPAVHAPESFAWERSAKTFLKDRGFHECMSYSLVSEALIEKSGFTVADCIRVHNPLSAEFEYLRPSILPSLLQNCADNEPKRDEIRLFELGTAYRKKSRTELPSEELFLWGAISKKENREALFRDVKGALEALLQECLGLTEYTFQPMTTDDQRWEKATALECSVDGTRIGRVGFIRADRCAAFGVERPTAFFDLAFSRAIPHFSRSATFTEIPKYPNVVRDVAFVIAKNHPYTAIESALSSHDPLIASVELFDIFESKKLPPGTRSLAVHLTYSSQDRTLVAEEVDRVHEKVRAMLEKKFNAHLR